MEWINPYDLLLEFGVSGNFYKVKRQILLQFELNDEINIHDKIITKNDIIKLFDYIEKNPHTLKLYKKIFYNKELNQFLYGKYIQIVKILSILKNKLNKEDKEFLKPFIVKKLKTIYKKAFKENYSKILNYDFSLFGDEIYIDVYKNLKSQMEELETLYNKNYSENNILNILNIYILNSLPEYFSKIRDDIANKVRSLAIKAYNDKEDIKLSEKILEIALSIKTSQKLREEFLENKKNLEEIKKDNIIVEKITKILDKETSFNKKIKKIIFLLNKLKYKINNNKLALITYNLINIYI